MRKKLLLFILLVSGVYLTTKAQDYNSSIGLRLGTPLSASFKAFLGGGENALELFVNYRKEAIVNGLDWTSIGFGASYQQHNPIAEIDGFSWYYGSGATVYTWSFSNDAFFSDAASISFGVQGYLGVDYSFQNIPINLSLDWVPTYFINGFVSGFGADYGAISIRYILSR